MQKIQYLRYFKLLKHYQIFNYINSAYTLDLKFSLLLNRKENKKM